MRQETRFEIGLLHDRVNALVTAEAFLTIAYTAAMSNGAPWGATFSMVASPVLSVLGLALALLACHGHPRDRQPDPDVDAAPSRAARRPPGAGGQCARPGGPRS